MKKLIESMLIFTLAFSISGYNSVRANNEYEKQWFHTANNWGQSVWVNNAWTRTFV